MPKEEQKEYLQDRFVVDQDVNAPATPSNVAASAPPAFPPALAAKYEPCGVIGTGGMAAVYKARHRITGKIVAIKVLHEQTRSHLERFRQEACAISNLSDVNVVGIYDFDIDDEAAYLIMEYVEGEPLSSILKREGQLSEQRFVQIFSQAFRGLQHAHKSGIVHRDLKPSNILISQKDGRDLVKIVDFGIAKVIEGDDVLQLTQTGELLGTPLYMSPEQSMGKQVDPLSDIYSMGCVMYESISGRPPITGQNFLEVVHRRLNDKPKSFEQLGLTVSPHLQEVIFRCLAPDATDRYQSAVDVAQELSSEDLSSMAPAYKIRPGKKKRGLSLSSVSWIIMSVILLGSVALLLGPSFSPRETSPAETPSPHAVPVPQTRLIPGIEFLQFRPLIQSDNNSRGNNSMVLRTEEMPIDDYQRVMKDARVQASVNRWKAYYGRLFERVFPEGTKIPQQARFQISATISNSGEITPVIDWQDASNDPKVREFTQATIKNLELMKYDAILTFPEKCDGISIQFSAEGIGNSAKLDGREHPLIAE